MRDGATAFLIKPLGVDEIRNMMKYSTTLRRRTSHEDAPAGGSGEAGDPPAVEHTPGSSLRSLSAAMGGRFTLSSASTSPSPGSGGSQSPRPATGTTLVPGGVYSRCRQHGQRSNVLMPMGRPVDNTQGDDAGQSVCKQQ